MNKDNETQENFTEDKDKMRKIMHILSETEPLMAISITASLLQTLSEFFLEENEENEEKINRGIVRTIVKKLQTNLEEKYGQSLFDEELDNKINGEKKCQV